MPKCEVCENQYDKAFEVVIGGERHIFEQLRVRNPRAGACLPALQLPYRRPRRRSGRPNLLLCTLRTRFRHNAVEGPRLKVGRVTTRAPCFTRTLMRLDAPTRAKYKC